MPIRALILLASIAVSLAGCGMFRAPDLDPGPSGGSIILNGDVPAAVRNRDPLPSCGVEHATAQNGPWNTGARRCLAVAYQNGVPAEFVSTRPSIEGDPIRMVFRVLGPRRVEIFVDSTQDAWSDRNWSHVVCSSLVIDETAPQSPDFGWGDDCSSEEMPAPG